MDFVMQVEGGPWFSDEGDLSEALLEQRRAAGKDVVVLTRRVGSARFQRWRVTEAGIEEISA